MTMASIQQCIGQKSYLVWQGGVLPIMTFTIDIKPSIIDLTDFSSRPLHSVAEGMPEILINLTARSVRGADGTVSYCGMHAPDILAQCVAEEESRGGRPKNLVRALAATVLLDPDDEDAIRPLIDELVPILEQRMMEKTRAKEKEASNG